MIIFVENYMRNEMGQAYITIRGDAVGTITQTAKGGNMKCISCPHFKIAYEPIKADKGYWDLGRAVCKKHDLVTDFANHGKLKRLECVEETE